MSVNTFKKGLNIDVSPQQQPEGTYRYALNAVMESRDGRMMDISNEDSNQLRFTLPEGYEPRGWVYKSDNSFYVFSYSGVNSEIGFVDKNWTYTTLINAPCLNFSRRIDAIYRLRRGCEDVVYFTDGLNPVRVINFSNLDQYYIDGVFDCNLIKLDRDFEFPNLDVQVIDSGGRLKLGTYRVFIQYLDEQFNATNFIWEAPPVRIYDENKDDAYDDIDGGYNLDSDPQNGVPLATKSLRVTVNNIDTNFNFYRIGLAVADSGEGTVNNFLLSPEISIESPVYTVTGDYSNYTPSSLEEFLIGKLRIDRAEHIEQIDNRLILANTKSGEAELCKLQRYASKITVQAITQKSPFREPDFGDSKNPNSLTLSFLGDEIYALGIVYTKAGYETPVYHIPGRPANAEDIEILEQWNPLMSFKYNEEEYNLLNQDDKFKNYELYNTATLLAAPQDAPWIYKTGYHQSKQVYPEIFDCDGNSVWGVDSEGNELVGTPIRHHRMPSRNLAPIIPPKPLLSDDDNYYLQSIHLKFDDIEIPNGYTGYYFVAGKRDAYNRTIWDKGLAILRPLNNKITSPSGTTVDEGVFNSYNQNPTSSYFLAITPKTTINKNYPEADYVVFENTFGWDSSGTSGANQNSLHNNNTIKTNVDYYFFNRSESLPSDYAGSGFVKGLFTERLENVSSVNLDTVIQYPNNLTDEVHTNDVLQDNFIFETDFNYSFVDPILGSFINNQARYVSFKINRDIHNNLFAINYRPIGKLNENITTQGDVFITHVGYPMGKKTVSVTGEDYSLLIRGDYISFWTESDINFSLRNSSFSQCGDYLNVSVDTENSIRKINNYYYKKRYDETNGEEIDCADYYALNPDFNILGSLATKLPIAREYDCCSDCDEVFKTRSVYSEQSFQEERSDFYRVFLPNNYRDIPGEKGEITNLFKFNDNLYIHTPEGLWQQPRSYQERVNADGTLSYLGTGSFFEQPPRIVFDAIGGSGGCVDKWSLVKSKAGVLWVDALGGEVYTLTNKVNAASNNGMRAFFRENLKSYLKDLFTEKGLDSPLSGDIISTYDPRFERYIITKLDYKPRYPVEFVDSNFKGGEPKTLYYNTDRNVWFITSKSKLFPIRYVPFGDPDYFENKSWTISYHPSGFFVAFHSYLPIMYAHNNDTFVSFKGNTAWSHDAQGTQKFFDEFYPHIIEAVHTAGLETKITDSFILQAEFRSGELMIQDVFFDDVILYNSRQCSGLVPLSIKKKGPNYMLQQANNTGIPVRNRENNYTLNHFRDLVVNTDEYFFTTSWDNIKDVYPIDKVINNLVFSNKPFYQKERFRDKYIIGRFIKYGGNDLKITTRFVANSERALPAGSTKNK